MDLQSIVVYSNTSVATHKGLGLALPPLTFGEGLGG
jgi:hypothetical protein